MTEKDFAGKLAAGMRRAKQPPTTEDATPATPRAAAVPQPATTRRTGEPPSANIADPWVNLHPKRIWPD